MSCAVYSACCGLVHEKIKKGMNEQRVMNASQEFGNVGQQHCIEDLTTMNKSSTKCKCHEEDEQLVAWDDVTGAMLDPDLVKEGRKAEPTSECYKETGKVPIGVRWVDVNKEDEKKKSFVQIPIGRQGLQQLQGTGFVHSDAAFGISASDRHFGCELPGQIWKCQPCLIHRAKFDAHVRPDLCRRFRAGRRTPMWQAACVNVWHKANRRKFSR